MSSRARYKPWFRDPWVPPMATLEPLKLSIRPTTHAWMRDEVELTPEEAKPFPPNLIEVMQTLLRKHYAGFGSSDEIHTSGGVYLAYMESLRTP